jgi:hypothetical protein
MITRLVGLVFAVISLLLLLRLALPYVKVPSALQGWVPGLITVTNWLIAPFKPLVTSFDMSQIEHDLGQFGGSVAPSFANKVDPALIVAIIGWGIVAGVVMFIASLVLRGH